jgi:hypothetical protein
MDAWSHLFSPRYFVRLPQIHSPLPHCGRHSKPTVTAAITSQTTLRQIQEREPVFPLSVVKGRPFVRQLTNKPYLPQIAFWECMGR